MEINMNQLAIKDPAIHGTALKPLQVYHQDYLFGGLLVPYHWHEEWEWIWVEDGEINITIAGKQIIAHKNDILFINSEEMHGISSINKTASIHHALVFSPEILINKTNDQAQIELIGPLTLGQFTFPSIISANNNKVYREIMHEIVQIHLAQNENWYFFLKIHILKMIYLLAKDNQINMIPLENNSKMEFTNTLIYIHENYMNKIKLDQLAMISNMSKGHFIRKFHAEIGQTPIEYINHYRIYRASKLFKITNQNVTEVALNCGFNNISYFIKLFKNIVGVSPKTFTLRYHR
ncbi:AraC family transcriptional regulator [Enterococcus faecium]|nr:hypothetical protein CUM94_10535 [Enterococcus faecium]PQG42562.1 hypothetical protein CUS36_13980 [Enterococcus faecium]QDA39644.1 AraC family transcriptional regulator [Enterococcus faecium]ROW95043.1 AraC family transcriptional regulator [Enterococcus faecium]ROX47617.1 AraC family transcriptional regulator [Enterococcus faecium]